MDSRIGRFLQKHNQIRKVRVLLEADRIRIKEDGEKVYYLFIVSSLNAADCRVLASLDREKLTGVNVTEILDFEGAVKYLSDLGAEVKDFKMQYECNASVCYVKADLLKGHGLI